MVGVGRAKGGLRARVKRRGLRDGGRCVEVANEAALVKAAAALSEECREGINRINVDEDYIVRSRDGGHALVRVASIHLPRKESSPDVAPIAASRSLGGDGMGMCRPYCCPPFPGRAADADRLHASGYVIKGWVHKKVNDRLVEVGGGGGRVEPEDRDTFSLNTDASALVSFAPADFVLEAQTKKMRGCGQGQASVGKEVRHVPNNALRYLS